jgi:large subunit ribosomal protein L35
MTPAVVAPRRALPVVVVGVIPDMPKMKTKRSAAKRFSFTGTGKVKRAAAYHRHNMTGKPTSAKVKQRRPRYLEPGDAALAKLMLPYG